MAQVNLLNNTWYTSKSNSGISVTIGDNTSYIEMLLPSSAGQGRGSVKVCVNIDVSKYQSISLSYSKVSHDGISSLSFGIYDDMNSDTTTPAITILDDGNFDKDNGGSITYKIPSDLSGTKYIGFGAYLNNYDGRAREKPYITSLTAVERSYTLTYDANGGTGAPDAVSDITSTIISSIIPTRDGYEFLGWSGLRYATTESCVAGDRISLDSDITLYAVWRKFYTITYDANGGSNAPSPDKKISGQVITIAGSIPTPPIHKFSTYTVTLNITGEAYSQNKATVTNTITYEFVEWNTKPDWSGVSYLPNALYSDDNDVILYAQYNATITEQLVSLPTPSRSGYEFLGWSINKDDVNGIIDEYIPDGYTTLYAIWKRKGAVYICDNAGGFSLYQVLIYDGSSWNHYIPYICTESGWIEYSG